MRNLKHIRSFLFYFLLLLNAVAAHAQTVFHVTSQTSFNDALDQANAGDSIVWSSGTYRDIFMDIDENAIVVTAEVSGEVIFNGASRVEISGDNITFSGFQFLGGNIGTNDVIEVFGSDILITQINIREYTCYKYLIVDEESRFTTISFSNFENRLNLDDQNILSILIGSEPGFHRIQYCSFKNFEGEGNDFGIEPIRIGLSTQGNLNGRTVVEFCYFSNCDGDGELISYKGAQNIIRYNTFENNSKAELVLRNGDEAIVYGNFFVNNMGGVRIREGQNHFVYNNYFQDLDRRAIFLQNDPSDQLDSIHIYFNTIVNSGEVRLGGSGDSPPNNVVFANNIFANPSDDLFDDPTGNETWIGNIFTGSLGINRPNGLENIDPQLAVNELGYYQIVVTSPAIDAAVSGFSDIFEFSGVSYDTELLLDLLIQDRPADDTQKDIGAFEFSSSVLVRPHATEENTGPFYLSDLVFAPVTTTVNEGGQISLDPNLDEYALGSTISALAVPDPGFLFLRWEGSLTGTENPQLLTVGENSEIRAIFEPGVVTSAGGDLQDDGEIKIYPNPSKNKLFVHVAQNGYSQVEIDILSINGNRILTQKHFSRNEDTGEDLSVDIASLSPGIYLVKIRPFSQDQNSERSYTYKLIKE